MEKPKRKITEKDRQRTRKWKQENYERVLELNREYRFRNRYRLSAIRNEQRAKLRAEAPA